MVEIAGLVSTSVVVVRMLVRVVSLGDLLMVVAMGNG